VILNNRVALALCRWTLFIFCSTHISLHGLFARSQWLALRFVLMFRVLRVGLGGRLCASGCWIELDLHYSYAL